MQASGPEERQWCLCSSSEGVLACQPGAIYRLHDLSTFLAILNSIVLPLNKPEVEAIIDPKVLAAHSTDKSIFPFSY